MAMEENITSIVIERLNADPICVCVGSFVTMQPSLRGPHKVKRARLNDLKAHWKGRVKKIQRHGKHVQLLVQHAYGSSDLTQYKVDKKRGFPKLQPNWLCLSDQENLVSAESITSTFHAFHFELGSVIFEGDRSTELRDRSIFFWKHMFYPKLKKILEVPLPNLADMVSLPKESMILMLIKKKLWTEIHAALKERSGVCGHVKVDMCIEIFISLFSSVTSVRKTPKMLTIANISDDILDSVLSEKWDIRLHDKGADHIECRISRNTLRLRYCLRKQTLYLTFKYRRWRKVLESHKWRWVPLDQDEGDGRHSEVVQLPIHMNGQLFKTVEVESKWSLFDIRQRLEVESDLSYFKFAVDGVKIGKRREEFMEAKDCLPPVVTSLYE